MLLDISKAFIDRTSLTEINDAAWGRIISAYQKAKEAEKGVSNIYLPSLIWSSIYRNGYMAESTSALSEGNIPQCRRLFNNFFRENLSAGLIGFSLEMTQTYMNKNQAPTPGDLNRYLSFAKNRIERFVQSHPGFDFSKLIKPNIGNPYGYEVDETFINICAEGYFNYSSIISKLLRGYAFPKLVELGGGYGGLAYFLIRDICNIKYAGFDLPENLALQTFYLMTAFPEKKFLLYGESADGSEFTDGADITLLPGFEIENSREDEFDLFFNSYSLAEMSKETVDKYVAEACRIAKKYLYHINVNGSVHHTNADHFPINFNKFELFLRYPDMWSQANGEGALAEVNEYMYLAKNAVFHNS